MKLLLDENLSPRLADTLVDLYPGSAHVSACGLERASDAEVWAYARAHGYVIVTKDADFSDLAFLLGSPPKIVWIRTGNCSTTEIEAMLRLHTSDVVALESNERLRVLFLY